MCHWFVWCSRIYDTCRVIQSSNLCWYITEVLLYEIKVLFRLTWFHFRRLKMKIHQKKRVLIENFTIMLLQNWKSGYFNRGTCYKTFRHVHLWLTVHTSVLLLGILCSSEHQATDGQFEQCFNFTVKLLWIF